MDTIEELEIIKPQEGFQTKVLSSAADIVICGGSGGAGKTAVLLLDAARWHWVPNYGAVIFRRTFNEIKMQDGLWDQSKKFYTLLGGKATESPVPKWEWGLGKSLSRISFSHLQYENDIYNHQGAQYAFIGFDELTHFSRKEFLYLLSRNRTLCGVEPVVRCTCNPDPQSWVADFISWFIDQETGFPIPERSGVLRYFTNDNSNFVFGDTKEEVLEKCPHMFKTQANIDSGIDPRLWVKSMTFIPGSVYENKILLDTDPRYLGNLMTLDEEDKLRLLDGNWKIGLDMAELFPLPKINDMFSAIPPIKVNEKLYITCDHARFGSDLCVIFTWRGWRVIRMDVLPISNSNDIVYVIQQIRQMYRPIPVSQILVDQDGIGVQDIFDCKVFQGASAASPEEDELASGKKVVIYKNRRTQNYFCISRKVTESLVSVDLNECYLWTKNTAMRRLDPPVRVRELKLKGTMLTIEHLIRENLRTVKRFRTDSEGKKMITPKEQQKNALGGLSPDWGDNFMMRAEFEWMNEPVYLRKR